MSIYRLYIQNNNHAGFWIQHRSWQNKCAQVQTIAGQSRGVLPGASPIHDGAEVLVLCFDVRSGPGTLSPCVRKPPPKADSKSGNWGLKIAK
jgi:hypothetical protein